MTVHIAWAQGNHAVLFADSQGSTATSESHGLPKIYAGPDFLLGGAGSVEIILNVFNALRVSPPAAADLHTWLRNYFDSAIRPEARRLTEFVLLTPGVAPIAIFKPGIFAYPSAGFMFASIGSGSEFVHRARMRDEKTGVQRPAGTLADLVASAENLADAANESLTVDDHLMIGLLVGDRAYVMGDREIGPSFLDPRVGAQWLTFTTACKEIRGSCEAVRGEEANTLRALTPLIRSGTLDPVAIAAANAAQGELLKARAQLGTLLADFISRYDAALGR